MKKFRTIFKVALAGACGLWMAGNAMAADASSETMYVVYDNGAVNPELHVYGWYNDAANFQAANPLGEGQVWEFKAADGGAAASMGLNMEPPQNTGYFHNATLTFSWYATTSAEYTIRLTSVVEENYTFTPTADQLNKWNTTSLNVAEKFPKVAKQWNENKNLGEGYIFSIVLTNGTAESVIYLNDIYYTGLDISWVAPEVVIPAPATVPTPDKPDADVFSFYSAYGNNVAFNQGWWGESTQMEKKTIDGKDVIYLSNFNYIGFVGYNINISDYDYMHVDYWTPDEGTPFGFVPISIDPTTNIGIDTPIWNAPKVAAGEWNSYDAPLSSFDADMAAIEQIKFVANQNKGTTDYAYLANIYFWKDENGGGGNDEPNIPEEPGTQYVLSGSITVSGAVEMIQDGNILKAYNVVTQPQEFNIKKYVDGELTETYGAATDVDHANHITHFGQYQGAPGSGINWILSAATQTNEHDFEYNLATNELTVQAAGTLAVGGIATDAGEAVYYDLTGRKVKNPERGIFIKVTNGKAVKEIKN